MAKVRIVKSISGRLLLAGAIFVALLIALGAYSDWLLSAAGDIVVETYDKPLMAINYARAATVHFVMMQNDILRARSVPPVERPAIAHDLATQEQTFFADLSVAQHRSTYPDELSEIAKVSALVKSWITRYHNLNQLHADAGGHHLDHAVLHHLGMLVEWNADHSFVGRRKAVWSIRRFKYAVGIATGLATLIAFIIGYIVLRRVVRPIYLATDAARKIGDGDLNCTIPKGRHDEAGVLLQTLGWMQGQIRSALDRESALRALAEIRLSDALESASEGVLLASPGGHIVIRNDQLARFFSVNEDALSHGAELNKGLATLENYLDSEGGPCLMRLLDARPGPGEDVTFERRLKSGQWLRFTASRTRDNGFLILVSDFSAVKEREAALQEARYAAEEASAAKSRFLATMSHELRTPLNAIIGFSEMIYTEVLGPVGVQCYSDYAGDILASGRNLLKIINTVLELTRYERNILVLDPSPHSLGGILRDVVEEFSPMAAAGDVTLALNDIPFEAIVFADGTKLRQVFENVLSNAIKFTPPGGSVDIRAEQTDVAWTIIIRDTGIGMTADEILVALVPFGQVDNRLERRYEGIGLGLPLAKALLDLHGGKLEIESTPGHGTSVRLVFPAGIPELAARAA
jgi:signal transduction histidine kinase